VCAPLCRQSKNLACEIDKNRQAIRLTQESQKASNPTPSERTLPDGQDKNSHANDLRTNDDNRSGADLPSLLRHKNSDPRRAASPCR